LRGIVNKFSRASSRKGSSLKKKKEYQTMHLDVVNNKLENSFIAEEERFVSAMERTGHKTFDFLQRLEAQVKESDHIHKDKF